MNSELLLPIYATVLVFAINTALFIRNARRIDRLDTEIALLKAEVTALKSKPTDKENRT